MKCQILFANCVLQAELSDYDIICTSETKVSNVVLTTDLTINGFRLPIRKDRLINNGAVITEKSINLFSYFVSREFYVSFNI